MDAKHCVVVLLWLAASRRVDGFVLSTVKSLTNSNADEPADEVAEVAFTPTAAFSIAYDGNGLEHQRWEYDVKTETIQPGVKGDADKPTAAIQGRTGTGDNGPLNEALPSTRTIILIACALILCIILLKYLLIKFIKRIIRHFIYQLSSVRTNMEISTVRYQKVMGEEVY